MFYLTEMNVKSKPKSTPSLLGIETVYLHTILDIVWPLWSKPLTVIHNTWAASQLAWNQRKTHALPVI